MIIRKLLIAALLFSLCSCGGRGGKTEKPVSPAERADYVLTHFWDAVDFSDTVQTHNREFVQRNIVDFISFFPDASDSACSQGIDLLLSRAHSDPVTFAIVTEALDGYLGDPNSPLRNEDHYIMYLETLLRRPDLPDDDRVRPRYKLSMARKNRPGSPATDFAYLDRDGNNHTLHTTAPGKPLLLIFYDPECDHCTEILRHVCGSRIITEAAESGRLAVLAIYTEGKRRLWDETKSSLPGRWLVGIDADSIVDRELYDLPAMPVMYLLDANRKVLLKDPTLQAVEQRM